MADTRTFEAESFGPNIWLIDEMYRRFAEDPGSVSPAWQEFFADYGGPTGESTGFEPTAEPPDGEAQAPAASTPEAAQQPASTEQTASDAKPVAVPAEPKPAPEPKPAAPAEPKPPTAPPPAPSDPPSTKGEKEAEVELQPLIGISATIAKRMDESLEVPTATSVRTVPAKLLEVNRRMINNQLGRLTQGGKVSFTHMIGFAVARALAEMPEMNVSYTEVDGKPYLARHPSVNLGLAVDQVRPDGTRVLIVPNIKGAEKMDFQGFWLAYEELIHRVRQNRLTPDDFAGTTATLTNPGMIGTVQSVPRLMPDQGVIVGVGAITYPPEYLGADEKFLARQGIGRVVTLTSTYDHRVIQGALSGEFLGRMQALLLGESGFYDGIFKAMKIPYTPARWAIDDNPEIGSPEWAEKQGRVFQIINMYRVRGHLIADLDPLRQKPPQLHAELDPLTYGLTIWDLDREFATGGLGGHEVMKLGDALAHLRDAYCRTAGIEYMHIQEPAQKAWIQDRVEAPRSDLPREERLRTLRKLNQAEAFERFLHTKYRRAQAVRARRVRRASSRCSTRCSMPPPSMGWRRSSSGWPTAGGSTSSPTPSGRATAGSSASSRGSSPETIQGSGDVKYHLGAKGTHTDPEGRELSVQVVANPSHLEAVDPVLEGQVRAKQELRGPTGHEEVLPVLIHGDAAFAGQGVVVETLNLSQLPGYRTGGTVHIVVNNQVGFTTSVGDARSSHYATDVAKTVQAPILHVNGDDPEAVVRVAQLAFDYRQVFNRDVVIDMVCYRRRGHNEGDEPSYTQPVMYRLIEQRRSVRKLYMERLVNTRELSVEEGEALLEEYRGLLEEAFAETKDMVPAAFEPVQEPANEVVPVPVSAEQLREIAQRVSTPPEGFTVHPKLTKLLDERRGMVDVRDGRLGDGRGVRHRLALRRRPLGAAHRGGLAAGDLQPPARSYHRLPDRGRLGPAAEPTRRVSTGADRGLAALGVRRRRVRVRVLGRDPRRSGDVGGAVRRLRQRRPGGDRPVHLRRWRQVGPAQRPDVAPPAWVRGAGTGAFQWADRALPPDVRR